MPVVDAHRAAPRLPDPVPARPVIRLLPLDVGAAAQAAERELLTAGERAHADRGVPAVVRRRVVLRAGLRRLAGEVLGIDPSRVPLGTGAHGRPELAVPGVDVSCSHSGEVGLVAVAVGHRVGVDVEHVGSWRDEILDEPWLTASERAQLRSLEPDRRAAAVTRCWTRKEAVLKGIGTGLLGSPADLHAGTDDGPVLVAGWRVTPVPVPGGMLASLATRPLVTVADAAAERSPHGHERL